MASDSKVVGWRKMKCSKCQMVALKQSRRSHLGWVQPITLVLRGISCASRMQLLMECCFDFVQPRPFIFFKEFRDSVLARLGLFMPLEMAKRYAYELSLYEILNGSLNGRRTAPSTAKRAGECLASRYRSPLQGYFRWAVPAAASVVKSFDKLWPSSLVSVP